MRLSICIPTHHGRCKFLKEAIESVLTQLTDELRNQVEICVSDNASEDGTRELMQQYAERYGNLFVYHRNERNMGQNYNLVRVVEIAHGDFCWYLGSDDQIATGGIAKILRLLEEHPDTTGVTVNWAAFDFHMLTPLKEDRNTILLLPQNHENMQVYSSSEDIFLDCGLAIGTMSRQIFDRQKCLDIIRKTGPDKLARYGTMVQFYLNAAMVRKHPQWIWYPEKLIEYRTDNFSLLQERKYEYSKLHLDIMDDASRAWADTVGRKSPAYRNFLNVGFLYMRGVPFSIKLQPNHTILGDLRMLIGFTKHWYSLPVYWLTVFPILLVPHPLLKAAIGFRSRLGLRTRLRALRARIG